MVVQAERLARAAVPQKKPVVKKKVVVEDTVRLALEIADQIGKPARKGRCVGF